MPEDVKVLVSCPECGKKYRVKSDHLGKHTTCSGCEARFTIDDGQGEAPAEPIEMDAKTKTTSWVDDSGDDISNKQKSLLQVGDSDDRYHIGEEIGRGGMGAILETRDLNLRRKVAMKVAISKKVSTKQLRRFIEEAQITGQLEHPNIVPVYELSVDGQDQVFYTMKMVHGQTLMDILDAIRRGNREMIEKYSLATLLDIYLRICDAISFAHSKDVIHRDIKSENIMIGDFGEVLVMDWGLSKILYAEHPNNVSSDELEAVAEDIPDSIETINSDDNSLRTLEGQVVGTPQFMAPEQATGKISLIGPGTDVYALGAVLYEILTLRPPVSGETVKEVLDNVAMGKIAPPSEFNTTSSSTNTRPSEGKSKVQKKKPTNIQLRHCPHQKIPDSLSAVCMRAMEYKIKDRYASVQELKDDVLAYQRGFATTAEEASAIKQLILLMQRHKSECGLLAAAALIIIGLVAYFVNDLRQSEQFALQEKEKAYQSERVAQYTVYNLSIREAQRLIEEGARKEGLLKLQQTADEYRGWEFNHLLYKASLSQYVDFVEPEDFKLRSTGTSSLVILPGNKFVASSSWRKQDNLSLWDIEKKAYVRSISADTFRGTGNYPSVNYVEASADGTLIAGALATGSVVIFKSDLSERKMKLEVSEKAINGVKFLKNEQLVTCSDDASIQVWDLSSGKSVKEFIGHQEAVIMVDVSKDGSRLISGSADNTAKIWDIASGKPLLTLNGHSDQVSYVCFSPDGKWCASTGWDMSIKIWSTDSGKLAHSLAGHSARVECIRFSPDGKMLVSTGGDRTIKLWNVADGTCINTLHGNSVAVMGVAFTEDGKSVISGGMSNSMKLWDLQAKQKQNAMYHGLDGRIQYNIKLSPSGRYIAMATPDSHISIRSSHTMEEIFSLKGHAKRIRALYYFDKGNRLASASEDGTIKIWNANNGNLLRTITNVDNVPLSNISIASDNKSLISYGKNHAAMQWNIRTGERIPNPIIDGNPVSIVKYSTDGKYLLFRAKETFKNIMYNIREQVDPAIVHIGGTHVVTNAGDLMTIYGNSRNFKSVYIFNMQTGKLVKELLGHNSSITAAMFSPAGERFYSGCIDGSMKVWDTKTWECLLTIEGPDSRPLNTISVSDDGRTVMCAYGDTQVVVYRSE